MFTENMIDVTQKREKESEQGVPDKKIMCVTDEWEFVFNQVESLSPEQQTMLFNALSKLRKPPSKPDLRSIPLWGGKKKDGPAIEWLDRYYGQWLKRCGANRNYIYRQDVETHDNKLAKRVQIEAREKKIKPRFFLPTISDEIDDIAKEKNIGVVEKRVIGAINTRKIRKTTDPIQSL
ncbi:MAG: hypothetical protein K0U54_05775 [Bacteroidetes bacterium]|nr:hypothetical protein [Bacteroidota bacterium]